MNSYNDSDNSLEQIQNIYGIGSKIARIVDGQRPKYGAEDAKKQEPATHSFQFRVLANRNLGHCGRSWLQAETTEFAAAIIAPDSFTTLRAIHQNFCNTSASNISSERIDSKQFLASRSLYSYDLLHNLGTLLRL